MTLTLGQLVRLPGLGSRAGVYATVVAIRPNEVCCRLRAETLTPGATEEIWCKVGWS